MTIHNEQTGGDVVVKASTAGDYTAPYLKPGAYTITATMSGFKTVSRTRITLNIDQTSEINFALPVGEVTETVTVVSDASQIDLSKGDRGEVIGGERVSELPLDGRNPFGLFTLSPGTHSFEASQYPRPFDLVTHQLYANGSPQPVELNIDGVTNEAGAATGAAGFVPSVDVLGEYKVVLNPYDASYSHGGGSSVDLSLKSGANAFHGTVNYFMRRSWLDADPWQVKYNASLTGTTPVKPTHKRDQYSVEGSGPIIIPHLLNGRDKLFYVVAYEEIKDITPNSTVSLYSVPNPAWANGDFSTAQFYFQQSSSNKGVNPCGAGVASCLQPLKIYDALSPLQTVVDPIDLKTKTAHSQFAGNIIPMNRLDPVGQAIYSAYKYITPNNNPGAGYAPYTNNFAVLPIENDTWRNALIKIDWKVRENDALSFRWGGQGRWNNGGLGTSGLPLADPANIAGAQTQPKSETGAIQWTHTFSPVLLLNVGATLITEAEVKSDYGPTFANESAALGFNPAYYNQLSNNNRFPYVTLSGLPNAAGYDYLSNTTQGSSRVYHTLQFLPTLTNVHGSHTIRAGIDIRFTQNDNPTGGTNDSYSFTGNFSNHYYNFADPTNYVSGSSAASLLLGYPNGGTDNVNLHSFYSQRYFAPWVQDDWKLTNKLTLNVGLRWDLLTPLVERHNKLLSAFNLTVLNPASGTIPTGTAALGTNTNLQGGVTFAGVNGAPRGAFALNKLQIQPRIGFAYAITERMVLRGGIGENYLNDQSANPTDGFSSSTGYTNSVNNGLTPYTATTGLGLSDPIPTLIQARGASSGYLQDIGRGVTFYNPHYHVPAFWNYSMTFEARITKRDTANVAYVGNRVPNGAVTNNVNLISPQFNAMCDLERGGNRQLCDSTALGQIANPFKGVAAFAGTGDYTSNTLSKSVFTQPYPEYGTINENGATNNQRTWYNSLQAVASHEVSRSLSLHFTYTKARAESAGGWTDQLNNVVSRTVSTTNDVAHAINLSGVGYLPFGQGRTYLSNVNRFVDEAINGWEIAPIYSWYSGFPWRPGGNWEMASTGGSLTQSMGAARMTLAPDALHSNYRIRGATPCVGAKDTDTGLIDTGLNAIGCPSIQFVTAPNGYAVGRNNIDFGVRQPGAYTFNVAIAKNFSIPDAQRIFRSESARLRLNVDLLNVFNHANWDEGYNSSATSVDFGTINKGPSAPTNLPRYLQLSAKVDW